MRPLIWILGGVLLWLALKHFGWVVVALFIWLALKLDPVMYPLMQLVDWVAK